jgi:hypothetical protein
MDCPNCKLVNPANATKCDCGYDFHTGTMQESCLKPANIEIQAAWFWLFAIWALLLLPWFFPFGLTGMMWDSGNPPSIWDYIGIACI